MPADKFNSFEEMAKSMGYAAPEPAKAPEAPPAKGKKQVPFTLPADYVGHAEEIMKSLQTTNRRGELEFKLTTTQLRNILTLINQIYNDALMLEGGELSAEINSRLQYLKVRLLYESGRTEPVKRFVEKAGLIGLIDGIDGERKNFERFARFMEALVAYHRFLGGKE